MKAAAAGAEQRLDSLLVPPSALPLSAQLTPTSLPSQRVPAMSLAMSTPHCPPGAATRRWVASPIIPVPEPGSVPTTVPTACIIAPSRRREMFAYGDC